MPIHNWDESMPNSASPCLRVAVGLLRYLRHA